MLILKRSSLKYLLYLNILVGLTLLLYYLDYTVESSYRLKIPTSISYEVKGKGNLTKSNVICPVLDQIDVDIDTNEIYPTLDLDPSWLISGHFWNNWFDARFQDLNRNSIKPPLKVILVPHSHNDPGWLETFDYYLQYKSEKILDNVIAKLQRNSSYKFIWAEVAFLEGWWKNARYENRLILEQLVRNGQFEIVTGGWVMPDEAITSLYGLVDQYIEGHQWLKTHLEIEPKYGWSIDPFGHSSTVAHLLSLSGIKGTVIQRIHFAWKFWFAYQRQGDFYWLPNYSNKRSILTHNQPYFLYDTKGSCGPHWEICNLFTYKSHHLEDFLEHLDELISEYERTGSLFKHNVVLAPIGTDFSYVNVDELNGNFRIYSSIIEEAKNRFPLIEISFGTVKDYFEEILKRQNTFPTLKGDFFVYADPFSFVPSYWSGFYSSRPFLKILTRILEIQLRTCEILYTITLNNNTSSNLNLEYEKIIKARRVLALMQHHDAITGTSKSFVVTDYISSLTNSINNILSLQRKEIEYLIGNNESLHIINEDNVDLYEDNSLKYTYNVKNGIKNIILFNSLLQSRSELIKIVVNNVNVVVKNEEGINIPIQISPVWIYNNDEGKIISNHDKYELSFIATTPPLSIVIYQIYYENSPKNMAKILSNHFHQKDRLNKSEMFQVNNISQEHKHIVFENYDLRVFFSLDNGLIKKVIKKSTNSIIKLHQDYLIYHPHPFRSGAYLSQPIQQNPYDKKILTSTNTKIMVVIGNVYNEMIIIHKKMIQQRIKIYNTKTYLSEAIFLDTTVDLESDLASVEVGMRFETNIKNKGIFYTDSNGFQVQKRTSISKIGIQGNYYPITSMIYIEDNQHRLSLLSSHSLGGTSFISGQLEVMIDRKIFWPDGRGLDEGVSDNKKCTHKFILLVERFEKIKPKKSKYSLPSYLSTHLSNSLNYPLNILVEVKTKKLPSYLINLISTSTPCGVHLVNLRTQPRCENENEPSKNALMVLHGQAYGCESVSSVICLSLNETESFRFNHIDVKYLKPTGLTGIENEESKLLNFDEMVLEGFVGLKTFNITFW